MVVADLPTWLETTAQLAAALTAIAVCVGLFAKSTPGKFIWHRLISEPLTEWNERSALRGVDRKINGGLELLQGNVTTLLERQEAARVEMEKLNENHEAIAAWVKDHTTWALATTGEAAARIDNLNARLAALEEDELRRREDDLL
jgi:hypothetical protein